MVKGAYGELSWGRGRGRGQDWLMEGTGLLGGGAGLAALGCAHGEAAASQASWTVGGEASGQY